MDIESDEDSKQRIHLELIARRRSEVEQLVAIDEVGKLFSVDNDDELYYVATLDAPAIATIIDAGKEREKSNQVVVEQDTREHDEVYARRRLLRVKEQQQLQKQFKEMQQQQQKQLEEQRQQQKQLQEEQRKQLDEQRKQLDETQKHFDKMMKQMINKLDQLKVDVAEPKEKFSERSHARSLLSYAEKREMELNLDEQPERRNSKPYAMKTDKREQAKSLLAYVEQREKELKQRKKALREAKHKEAEREKALFEGSKRKI